MKAKILALALSSLVLCSYASADPIYTNGSPDKQTEPAQISAPQSITDSFIVMSNRVILTDATIGAWVPQGDVPTSVAWSISTTEFGSEIASGTSLFTSNVLQYTTQYTADDGSVGLFDVYLSNFVLSATLDPGIYWLTLSNGMSDKDGLAWGVNGGPSSAFYAFPGETGSTPSEYFQLNGTVVASNPGDGSQVPEPASLAIFGAGMAGLAAVRRRKHAV